MRVIVGYASQEHNAVTHPLYSYAEADRLVGVTPNTSRRWLKGYHFWYSPQERRTMPPITPGRGVQEAVSFVDLMEVAAIGKLKGKGFSLKRIRQINEYCRLALQKPRPLVTEKFRKTPRPFIYTVSKDGEFRRYQ